MTLKREIRDRETRVNEQDCKWEEEAEALSYLSNNRKETIGRKPGRIESFDVNTFFFNQ